MEVHSCHQSKHKPRTDLYQYTKTVAQGAPVSITYGEISGVPRPNKGLATASVWAAATGLIINMPVLGNVKWQQFLLCKWTSYICC